jgi:hypothetical protein
LPGGVLDLGDEGREPYAEVLAALREGRAGT